MEARYGIKENREAVKGAHDKRGHLNNTNSQICGESRNRIQDPFRNDHGYVKRQLKGNKEPLRPSELFERVIQSHKMGHSIRIPTMKYAKSYGKTGSTSITSSCRSKLHTVVTFPRFCYEHGGETGKHRNLPFHPEMVRLLADTDNSINDNVADDNWLKDDLNPVPSFSGGSLSPPLINYTKQKKPRRQKEVCKFCKRPPTNHQKWCIHYDNGKSGDLSVKNDNILFYMRKSNSNSEHQLNSSEQNTDDTPTLPPLVRSKSCLEDKNFSQFGLPEYQTIHRDVYIRALADARARLMLNKAQNFIGQTTKPWVFSYFTDDSRGLPLKRKQSAMSHIFGKGHTDFTEYYQLIVKETEQKKKVGNTE